MELCFLVIKCMNNISWDLSRVSNTRPARAFCAAHDAFWEFSNN